MNPYTRSLSHEASAWYMGALFTFLAETADTGGELTVLEAEAPRGVEPPPHIHTREDEAVYVLEGNVTFHIADKDFPASKGTFVYMPRNVVHNFTIETETVKMLVFGMPAGMEGSFREMSEPAQELALPPLPETEPDIEKLIEVDGRYGVVYPEIPARTQ